MPLRASLTPAGPYFYFEDVTDQGFRLYLCSLFLGNIDNLAPCIVANIFYIPKVLPLTCNNGGHHVTVS